MRKNIVVLLLDTLRASDAYDCKTMPYLNYLARNTTAYTRAISPATWTAPSHASLFTDMRAASIPGVSRNFLASSSSIDPWMVKTKFLKGAEDTIARRLSPYGYYSVLFSNNPFLTSFTNLATGFDKVYDIWLQSNVKYNKRLADKLAFLIDGGERTRNRVYEVSNIIAKMLPKPVLDRVYLGLRSRLNERVANADGTFRLDRGISDTNAALSNYLEYNYNYKPHFMFLNLMEAHENYPVSRRKQIVQDKWLYLSGIEELSEDIAMELHNGYRKRLRYLDRKVNESLSVLRSHGMLDNTTVIITSDHGQLFGEHGLLYHSLTPYDNLVNVPLVSANYENGSLVRIKDRVDKPVSMGALHQAIIDLASGKEEYLNGNLRSAKQIIADHSGISEGWDGLLLEYLKNRSRSANMIYRAKTRCNARATAVYSGSTKLIHYHGKRQDELYNLASDPEEQYNIISEKRNIALSLARAGAGS